MRKSLVSITRDAPGIESALHSAAEIADGNADLSAHTQRQAASLEEAAASMAQLASTVKQNASSAFEADQKRRPGHRRGAAARWWATRSRPCRASQSTSRISEIVGIIDGIAFQTNIWRSMPPWKPPAGGRGGLRGGGGRGAQPPGAAARRRARSAN